jgi:hypothetical protein
MCTYTDERKEAEITKKSELTYGTHFNGGQYRLFMACLFSPQIKEINILMSFN